MSVSSTCPFGDHPAHLAQMPAELGATLETALWPATADLIPPETGVGLPDWIGFYTQRILLGVLAIYPRTLSAPLTFVEPDPFPPGRILELLMVPRWARGTALHKRGVQSARDSYLSKIFGCCEYARLIDALLDLWPESPPAIYALTHHRLAGFLEEAGYHRQSVPPELAALYTPPIAAIVARDHPLRAEMVTPISWAHVPGNAAALRATQAQVSAYGAAMAERWAARGGSDLIGP